MHSNVQVLSHEGEEWVHIISRWQPASCLHRGDALLLSPSSVVHAAALIWSTH